MKIPHNPEETQSNHSDQSRQPAPATVPTQLQSQPPFKGPQNAAEGDNAGSVSEWAIVDKWPLFRRANVGDRGWVLGAVSHDGSGLLKLAIQVSEQEVIFLEGDWRSISHIVDDLANREVEIIQGEGSIYGLHNVRPVQNDFADQNEFADQDSQEVL